MSWVIRSSAARAGVNGSVCICRGRSFGSAGRGSTVRHKGQSRWLHQSPHALQRLVKYHLRMQKAQYVCPHCAGLRLYGHALDARS